MKKLFLIGGGGHCRSCIDVIESTKEFEIIGIFDIEANIGQEILGYKIIGSDIDISRYVTNENHFLITLGQIKTADIRKRLFKMLKGLEANLAIVVSNRAYVSKSAHLGEGTIVMHDALVNANAQVGVNCIINTKSLIEHDAIIGSHCHASTASVINGGCIIESECFIGSNAVLKHGITITGKSLIKGGSYHAK